MLKETSVGCARGCWIAVSNSSDSAVSHLRVTILDRHLFVIHYPEGLPPQY